MLETAAGAARLTSLGLRHTATAAASSLLVTARVRGGEYRTPTCRGTRRDVTPLAPCGPPASMLWAGGFFCVR